MAKVRLANSEHLLHRDAGQTDLAAYDPAPAGNTPIYIEHLDEIRIGERHLETRCRWIDRHAVAFGAVQLLGDFRHSRCVHLSLR
jgi:hypothetical protein